MTVFGKIPKLPILLGAVSAMLISGFTVADVLISAEAGGTTALAAVDPEAYRVEDEIEPREWKIVQYTSVKVPKKPAKKPQKITIEQKVPQAATSSNSELSDRSGALTRAQGWSLVFNPVIRYEDVWPLASRLKVGFFAVQRGSNTSPSLIGQFLNESMFSKHRSTRIFNSTYARSGKIKMTSIQCESATLQMAEAALGAPFPSGTEVLMVFSPKALETIHKQVRAYCQINGRLLDDINQVVLTVGLKGFQVQSVS